MRVIKKSNCVYVPKHFVIANHSYISIVNWSLITSICIHFIKNGTVSIPEHRKDIW